jgi:hypothetical protein
MQPRNADPIALLDAADGTADRGHCSHAFVARDERRFRFDGPIAMCGVEVGVADPGRRDADEDLILVRLRNGYFLNDERLAEFADDGCFHRGGHQCSPISTGADRNTWSDRRIFDSIDLFRLISWALHAAAAGAGATGGTV